MTIARCVSPRCCSDRREHGTEGHECDPRIVRDAAYLCIACRSRLAQRLVDLPDLHEELSHSIGMLRRLSGGTGRSKGVNLDEIVTRARDHIVALLFDWSRIVAEERGLVLPSRTAPDVFAHWLGRHVDWLSHQPFADEVADNVEETWSEARRARQIVPARRIRLELPDKSQALCTERAEGPVEIEGGPPPMCPGFVEAWVRDDSALLPSEIMCSENPDHRWSSGEWHRFVRDQRRAADLRKLWVLAKTLGA